MRVYISYSVKDIDQSLITALMLKLSKKGFDVETGIESKLRQTINESEIIKSDYFIAIQTTSNPNENFFQQELDIALANKLNTLYIFDEKFKHQESSSFHSVRLDRKNISASIESLEGIKKNDDKWALIIEIIQEILKAFSSNIHIPKLKQIESSLIQIDPARFQELCDAYLYYVNDDFPNMHRIGSQKGKYKTVKGTPDTFIADKNGNYIFIEYTTKEREDNKKSFLSKLKDDLLKCLNENSLNVKIENIKKIILCFNSIIPVKEAQDLFKIAKEKSVELELIGIDSIALGLYGRFQFLAKEYLGITISSNQILKPDEFIKEYERGNLATPLSNKFHFRESDLTSLKSFLNTGSIIIVTGSAGVGKSRLSLKLIEDWIEEHKDYTAYCISNKNASITDDLRTYFDPEKKYIILIDDANRQISHFISLLSLFRESKNNNFKIIITVRDYAFKEVENRINEFLPHIHILNKFTPEEITEILKSDEFQIKNNAYINKIIDVSNGNPRLALMAAKLALSKQSLASLNNVYSLYDTYFKSYINDYNKLGEQSTLKTLGILSFFYSIELDDNAFIEQVCHLFDIDIYDFKQTLTQLENLEIVDIPSWRIARVSEQVLSTYFFYKSFFEEGILSFDKLLNNYFKDEYFHRFSDTVIFANNTFGYENVLKKIDPVLSTFWLNIKGNKESAAKFLDLFWFYKQEETIEFYFREISELPVEENPVYNTEYKANDYAFDKDKIISQLNKLLYFPLENFEPALELCFEYARKKSSVLPELIKTLDSILIFHEDDIDSDFQRQKLLFDLLISKMKEGDILYTKSFIALAPTFLKTEFQSTKGGRNNTIVISRFALPLNPTIEDIRRNIWENLNSLFSTHSKEVIQVISKYATISPDIDRKIISFDLDYVINIIENKFIKEDFQNCYIVNKYIAWLNRIGVGNKTYLKLKPLFTNPLYESYCKLSWNRLRDKEDYEFENYKEYEALKEEEIRASFIFSSLETFKSFYKGLQFLINFKTEYDPNYLKSLDIIIDENLIFNEKTGLEILEYIARDDKNSINFIPYLPVKKLLSVRPSELKNLIFNNDFSKKTHWGLVYLELLPEELISLEDESLALTIINNISEPCYVSFKSISRFSERIPRLFDSVLGIINDKIENQKIRITLEFDFFQKYIQFFRDNISILKKAYLLQDGIQSHFDYDGEDFLELIKIDKNFLIEYIAYLFESNDRIRAHDYRNLSIVWEVEEIDNYLEKALIHTIENEPYFGIMEHFGNAFFYKVSTEFEDKASKFIISFITKYNNNPDAINAIFDIIRHSFKSLFEEAFLHFISINHDVEIFKKIHWKGSGGVYAGEVIIGELRANDWKSILELLNKSDEKIKLISHKAYLKEVINHELRYADWERKRKFIEGKN